MLVLQYEQMKENAPREIRRIARFIGLKCSEDEVERVARLTHFDQMKKDDTCNYSRRLKHNHFIRSGKVGGWKEVMSDQQAGELEQIEEGVYERFKIQPIFDQIGDC